VSDEIEILPVEIHLPGLLKLLGEHLYSNPQVAVREMVQNAHDSCVRRREEDKSVADAYQPSIAIFVDAGERQLVIEDNGSGLTREEIATFLATVGRGYTGQLRAELESAGRAEALDLIGMFGLGLLSAFMVALRIEITTASYQTPETAWRWISEGGQSYALRRATRESVGTTVRLDLRDDAKFLLEPSTLEDILTVYAEFLTIPIFVNRGAEPINGQPAPWQQENEQGVGQTARYIAWVEARRGMRPLTVIPLEDVTLEDGRHVPLDGVLYVPPRSIISIQEYGDVTIYVRHMLITERERDLLPEWARFVTGVIDCPLLNPTASRESLRHDEIYGAVQAALARQLLAHFERLAESAPVDWAAVVQAHNDLIKGWAVRSPELFVRVADLVVFKTSRGQLTLPEYLHENPGRIFYYGDDDGVTQALALFEARRLAVVDARWFADVAFLRAYGEVYGVPAEELAPGAGYLFATVDDPEGVWQPLLDAYRAEGYPVRLLSFEPEHLPMILLYPPGAERLRRAQRNMDDGRYAGPIRRLVRGYLDRQQPDEAVLKGTLHLNARNPLLRRVRDLGPEHADFNPLLGILVANARMFAGQGLSAQDAIACFEQINRSLARLAGLEEARSDGRTALTVAMLTDLGLHPDAASRLAAACETVEDLLAADVATLAERTRVSTLMLATVREELKRAMSPAEGVSQDTIPETPQDGSGVISLTERREQPDEGKSE
jgi:molecular chaperone HtpG